MKNLYKIEDELYIVSDKEKSSYCIKECPMAGLNIDRCDCPIQGGCSNKVGTVILTTNKNLIKYGVQAIDNEFLEWFVKNSSCKEVEVERSCLDETAFRYNIITYKINKCLDCNKLISDCSCIEQIVEFPKQGVDIKEFERKANEIIDSVGKQEQKQHLIDIMKDDEELGMYEEETIEEAAQSYAKTVNQNHTSHMLGFLNGAKWAQERSFSEQDLKEAYMVGKHGGVTQTYYEFEDFIKQLKNK